MTIGERIAFYRRRRGLSQEVLAGLIGRTADWLRKVEHDRIPLDRLSVIRLLASTLDVTLGDLLGEPALMGWTKNSGTRTVPALRAALMDHRQFLPRDAEQSEPQQLDEIEHEVAMLWADYQRSRYSSLAQWLPVLVTRTQTAVSQLSAGSGAGLRSQGLNALALHLATTWLTKLGEADLASIAAAKGLAAAYASEDELTIGSLYRAVAHAMLSIGEHRQALLLARASADRLQKCSGKSSPEYLSVYGTLLLVGAVAASRDENRQDASAFLSEADESAARLGSDANCLWTAFGPTNVAIHRVHTALELGDVQVAMNLGPKIDTSALPLERRVRHAIETARAYARWNRVEQALDTLLDAERQASEQVRYHRLSRGIVREILRRRRAPSRAVELARRMGVRHVPTKHHA